MATADDIAQSARSEKDAQARIWDKRGSRKRGGSKFQFALMAARPWLTDFNPLRLVRDVGDVAAVAIYQAIADGKDPATGASRPPPKHRVGGVRLVDTGELLESITRSKISGKSAAKARCVIRPKRNRRGAVNAEAGRGLFVFRLDGQVGAAMNLALDDFVLDGLGVDGFPPGPGDLAQVRAWQLLGHVKPGQRRRRGGRERARPDAGGIFGV